MKNLIKHLFVIATFTTIVISCNKPTEEKTPEVVKSPKMTKAQIDSIGFVYVAVKDSLDASWSVMIQDDDEKIADMNRLLEEVAKTRRYDKARHKELVSEVGQLAKIRYDRTSMADSDKIDEYDSATSVVTKDVILFAANHPEYKEYPQLEEIISEIQAADNRVILHRIRYDRSAKGFNSFVQENEEHMDHFVSNKEIIKEAPLFELSN